MKRFAAVLSVVLVSLIAAGPARAVDEAAAAALVTRLMQDAVAELGGKSLSRDERTRVLEGFLERYGDMTATSGELLGRHLATTSEDDRRRFERTFVDFILASWTDYLADISPDQRLTVTRTERQGDRLRVYSVAGGGEDAVPVEWSVADSADGRPYVADVSMEGISIIRMMRADFTSVLTMNKGNVDALINALRKKIAVSTAAHQAEATPR